MLNNINKKMRIEIQVHPKRKMLSVRIYTSNGLLIDSGSQCDFDLVLRAMDDPNCDIAAYEAIGVSAYETINIMPAFSNILPKIPDKRCRDSIDMTLLLSYEAVRINIRDAAGILMKGGGELPTGFMYEGDEAIVHGLFKEPVDIGPLINGYLSGDYK